MSAFAIPDLSRYIYGTTRLGDEKTPIPDRIKIAHAAMFEGVWFHTSRQYGNALEVLGQAFAQAPAKIPKLIFKIGHNDLAELRTSIATNLAPLGLKHIDVGQLCLGGAYAESARTDGKCFVDFRQLKAEGLVRNFVMEVFPWTSDVAYEALSRGFTDGIVDAFIFYLNPLQRFASNRLWNLLHEKSAPIIAMRTVCGAPVHALRDVPGAAWVPYLQQRATEIAPIFEHSGVRDWTEFCFRFAFSFPLVKATVGSTNQSSHLDAFLRFNRVPRVAPLPAGVVEEITKLQARWSDEVDVRAQPWTM